MAQNKFIFADRHGLICRLKPNTKDSPKPVKSHTRRNSVTSAVIERKSLGSNYSNDDALSSSVENLHQLTNHENKKNESFFYGFFNDNHSSMQPKKTVTIMEPNGHKVYPIKPIKKDKINDGNKRIIECHLKLESFLDLSAANLNLLSRSISKLVHLTQLYIYGNKITTLPKEIGSLINLKELWMQENNIEYLPIEMKNCKSIQHLDIRHNHLSDESLLVLTHLLSIKILLITHNKITRLDGIGRLKKLETLSVKSNKLEGTITKSLGKLQLLVSLDLSKNRIVMIPSELGNCVKLKRLNLEYNKIIELPESIGNLKELEFIGIKYNQLEKLPSTLNECILLKELNIESNLIYELPSSVILKLHQTTKLNISHNKFTTLPISQSEEYSNIEKINAEYNNISSMSGALLSTKNLRILNLCYNDLSEIQTDDIHNLLSLVDLNLSFNHITELPKDICRLSYLESLDLTNNLLTTTPPEIGDLKNLKFLNLESNVLESLPEEFGNLENLKNLNISSNRLKDFPSCIIKLKKLEMLNISENVITELPKSISDLSRLTHLFLKDNVELNNLPVSLASMKSLNFLSLNGCPLQKIPVQYTKSPISVIAYLKALEIGLKLQEYFKISSDNNVPQKPISSSDTALNVTEEQTISTNTTLQKDEKSVSSKQTHENNSLSNSESIRPRSLSVSSGFIKEHKTKSKIRKPNAQEINIPDSLVKKMKTTEAGFLACSKK